MDNIYKNLNQAYKDMKCVPSSVSCIQVDCPRVYMSKLLSWNKNQTDSYLIHIIFHIINNYLSPAHYKVLGKDNHCFNKKLDYQWVLFTCRIWVAHLCLTHGSGSIFSSHGISAIDTGAGSCHNLSDDMSFSISVTNGSINSFCNLIQCNIFFIFCVDLSLMII